GRKVKRPIYDEETGLVRMKVPHCNVLLTKHWDAIIVDEAHRMKNPDTQWTRNIKKLRAPFKHIMTGTGFVNNPAEIHSLLSFLFPDLRVLGVPNGYWGFRDYFCDQDDYSGYRKITGIKPHMEREFKELVRRVGVR